MAQMKPFWANALQHLRYKLSVEKMNGPHRGDDEDSVIAECMDTAAIDTLMWLFKHSAWPPDEQDKIIRRFKEMAREYPRRRVQIEEMLSSRK